MMKDEELKRTSLQDGEWEQLAPQMVFVSATLVSSASITQSTLAIVSADNNGSQSIS